MLRKIKAIANHKVSQNAFFLALIQLVNIGTPLLIYPAIASNLEVSGFAISVIIFAVVQFAYVFTDYGFSLSATYRIALNAGSMKQVSEIVSTIFGVKLLLLLVLSLIAATAFFVSDITISELTLLLVSLTIISQCFQPVWFFQGIQETGKLAAYVVIARIINIGLVYFLLPIFKSLEIVVAAMAASNFVGTFVAMIHVKRLGVNFEFPKWSDLINELKYSFEYFWSRLAVSLFSSVNTIILGIYSTPYSVAAFSSCEQVYRGGQAATNAVNQAMFPHMAKCADWNLFFKLLLLVLGLLIVVTLCIAFFAESILVSWLGVNFREAAFYLQLFMIVSIINYLSVVFGYPAFSAFNNITPANRSVLYGVLVHFFAVAILWYLGKISVHSIIMSVMLTESFILIYRLKFLLKLHKIQSHSISH